MDYKYVYKIKDSNIMYIVCCNYVICRVVVASKLRNLNSGAVPNCFFK